MSIEAISLGAGIQSSAMALMACHGLIQPMPSCAIFADTGDESEETYAWLKELTSMLSFPVFALPPPNGMSLSASIVNQWGFSQIPAWIRSNSGRPSIGRRQCTRHFKIAPVRRELRKRFPGEKVVLWQGISLDELSRMKDSGLVWLTHRFPLVEHRKTRADCVDYILNHTSTRVPKSACVYCPYKDRERWRETSRNASEMVVVKRVESVLIPRGEFLTNDLLPVGEIDFDRKPTERDDGQLDLFTNECEGMCGV